MIPSEQGLRMATCTVAVDPGKTCGVVWYDPLTPEHRGQNINYEDALETIFRVIVMGVYDRIVVERFNPRRRDPDSQLTMEIIGALKFIAHHVDVDIAEVNAADKKKTMNEVNPRFKDHARDAEAIRIWDLRYGKWVS